MSNYEKALQIAERAHAGQCRRNGGLYIEHPKAVAKIAEEFILKEYHGSNHEIPEFVLDFVEELKCVAILHDTVEDTDLTYDDLREAGFSPSIVAGVKSVTEQDGDTYLNKVQRAANNELGIIAKMSDITHNMSDLDRKKGKHFYDKYELAKHLLREYYYKNY